MKRMQKLLVITIAILLTNFACALEIIDVKSNYWAGSEIIKSIQNGYLPIVDGNKFKPEGSISRSEFVTALLKVIRRQNEEIVQKTSFKDVTNLTPNRRSVILSEQIRMAFGYPDKTFKPNLAINHNETMSMIANITKGGYDAADITYFADYLEIPIWARRAYIKNVANGFYVNYPDEMKFMPANNLTRAEAAVLFDKISADLSKVQDKYRDLFDTMTNRDDNGFNFIKARFIAEENLDIAPFATNNKVQIYDNKKVIEAGNILIGTTQNVVKVKEDLVGHEYIFVAPNDVYTVQGTLVYPKGTEFYARVEKLGYSAWRSRPEESNIVFRKYSLPTGETYDMAGVPFTKNDKIVYVNNIKNEKQAMKLANNTKNEKEGMIKAAHQMSPLTDYAIKENETIYILLTGDMVIPQNEDYFNLRTKGSLLDEEDNDM